MYVAQKEEKTFFFKCKRKDKDISALKVNSVRNFSWTRALFFHVLGSVHKKVKEIMVKK